MGSGDCCPGRGDSEPVLFIFTVVRVAGGWWWPPGVARQHDLLQGSHCTPAHSSARSGSSVVSYGTVYPELAGWEGFGDPHSHNLETTPGMLERGGGWPNLALPVAGVGRCWPFNCYFSGNPQKVGVWLTLVPPGCLSLFVGRHGGGWWGSQARALS